MKDNNVLDQFNDYFSRDIKDKFLFPFDTYRLFLEGLSIDPLDFLDKWSDDKIIFIVDKYWKKNTKLDWKWSLSFPLFSLLEKYVNKIDNPTIIGLSGLPGSGKSTLGFWIDSVARDLLLDIKVISLDDFYLPSKEMDIAVKGNPWNVPRGFPGTHSLDLLNQSLDTFLETGVLANPTFDKSLRNGKGDRSGWCEAKPKVLILEGWFVGCQPISNFSASQYVSSEKLKFSLTEDEKEFSYSIQQSLINYSKIWKKFDKIWHLKASEFNNTILWKKQQESQMINLKGSGLKDDSLNNFIRMIQAAIPQECLTYINSDTSFEINQNRRILKFSTNQYYF